MLDSSLGLLAAGISLLDDKTIQSLKLFGWHPVVYIPLLAIAASFGLGYLLAKGLRLKDYGWRFGIILAAWAASIAVVLLGQFKLGADLSGGVNLVYQVNEEETRLMAPQGQSNDYDLDAVVDVLRRRLNPSGVKELVIRKSGPQQIEIIVAEVDQAQVDRIKKLVITGGALRFLIVANDETKDGHIIEAAREQSAAIAAGENSGPPPLSVTDEEGNEIGLWRKLARELPRDPSVDPYSMPFRHGGAYNDVIRDARTGIIIELTPTERSQIGTAAAEDRIGHALADVMADRGIRDVEILLRAPDSPDIDVRGDDLAYAQPGFDASGWHITFTMKGEGIGKMSALTGQNLPKPERGLAIVFDNELISAPIIQGHISEQGQITGRFSEEEVTFMSELLKSGSMPVVLHETPIAENLIGSTLGRDTIVKGSWSLVIALALVLIVITVYYRFAGFVAALALTLNLLMTVAIMVIIQAPFTLPGLAGLVLTVGMSIDANVLIFERIKEETARGAALRMAIRNGFDKALSAIIDGNLTTFLTALVLYVIGTDQLRGFGVTLMLGNMISMFTAIFCARVIFDAGERTRWLKSLSMTHFLTNPTVDWVKLFVPMTVVSGVLIVIGLVATVARGAAIFDIDLKGGTTVTPMFREPLTDAEVRAALAERFADVRDPKTGGLVDYQVYAISLQGEPPNTVYKIDSSLETVAELQKHVQAAFPGQIRTYEMNAQLSTAIAAGAAETSGTTPEDSPPDDDASAPKASRPAVGPPKTPPATDNKSEPEKAEETPAAKDASGCGQEEADQDAAKAEDAKSEDVKSTEEKAEPAEPAAKSKSEPAPSDEAKESTAETAPPPASSDESTAPDATAAPDTAGGPPTVNMPTTTWELTFPNNAITAAALEQQITDVAARLEIQRPTIEIDNEEWDKRDNSAFENWTVTLGLGEVGARSLIRELEQSVEQTPVWQNSSSVSGQVTVDMQLKALVAILVSLVGIAAYIWFRFQKLSWGIAAVAALVHDTLVMIAGIGISAYVASALGFLLIQEFKISLTVVAGFLTLIGYSVNDTIVIFDRIREIRGKTPQLTRQMINDAVNQTLSRTLLTGGLTGVVVLILYIWGGEGIHAFAFSMLIGVISGTYSTVFIAAPLLLWLLGERSPAAQPAKVAPAKQPVTTGGRV